MSWSKCCGSVMAFTATWQRHMLVQKCPDSGGIKKLFCKCSLLRQEANEELLNVWLY